jgi:hypothetical protein
MIKRYIIKNKHLKSKLSLCEIQNKNGGVLQKIIYLQKIQ